jgi:hypothetical protein
MNDPFEQKVRAAAVVGWWVVLFAYVLLAVVWVSVPGSMVTSV